MSDGALSGISGGGFTGGYHDGNEFPCFSVQVLEYAAISFAQIRKYLEPVPGFVCLFFDDSKFCHEVLP